MKSYFLKSISILAISIFLSSCEKNVETPKITETPFTIEGYTKLSEGYAMGASTKIEVWGKKTYFVGYNNIKVVLLDSLDLTQRIKDAHVYFEPLMTMNMNGTVKQHACPVENPDETAINEVFPGAVLFSMPTGMGSTWKFDISVHNHKYDKEGTATFDISVVSPPKNVLTVFTSQSADSSKLILTMLEPTVPQVGVNDIEFTIHKMADMLNYPPDNSYTIEITPEMPSMGHGSPNNVNPVSVGNGHYIGKVNFTMTGEWKINVVAKKDGAIISKDLYFNVVL